MQNLCDRYKDPDLSGYIKEFRQICSDVCGCTYFDAPCILDNLWDFAKSKMNERSNRIGWTGPKIIVFGSAASVALGHITGDPRISVGGMILSSLIGTGVSGASQLMGSDNKWLLTRQAKQELANLAPPERQNEIIKPSFFNRLFLAA